MDRKKGDVKYQTTQTGETGKAELFRIYLAECRGPFGLFFAFLLYICMRILSVPSSCGSSAVCNGTLHLSDGCRSHGGLQKVQEKIQDSRKNQEGIFDGSGQLLSG